MHSEHGYFEHHHLDARLKNVEGKNKTLRSEAKEKASRTVKLEVDLQNAKQEIVSLQNAIQELQVCFTVVAITP